MTKYKTPLTAYLLKEKVCPKCKILKPTTLFYKIKAKNKCGESIRYTYCLSCKFPKEKVVKSTLDIYLQNFTINNIYNYLKKANLPYNRKHIHTFIKALNFTTNDFKNHLIKLFEPWMNIDNCKNYSKSMNKSDLYWQPAFIKTSKHFSFTKPDDEFKSWFSLNNIIPMSCFDAHYIKQNNINESHKARPKNVLFNSTVNKICKNCNETKLACEFRVRHQNTSKHYISICKACEKQDYKKYIKNKSKDPQYKLRSLLSGSIRRSLKRQNLSKNKKSCMSFLPYSIKELKAHLESLFEPWMSWSNWGIYNPKTWDDNDINTWTWQIDHIIPASDLTYKSMGDESFKLCWALSNLRPLSAKQNNHDGATRVRHKKH